MPANPRTLALEQLYLRDQRALQRRVAQQVRDQWAAVDPDSLAPTIRRFVAGAGAVVTVGQRVAQVGAAAFTRTVLQLETRDTLPARGTAPGVAGRTTDGRPVTAVLAVVAPVVFTAIRGGMTAAAAMRYGAAAADRAAVTSVADAARQEVDYQGKASGGRLSGWVWVVDSAGGCAACLASADGTTHDWGDDMPSHPWCSCQRSPVATGADDNVPRPTGQDIFDAMSPAQQVDTFHSAGDAKAALVADGSVTLADLTERTTYHDWRATLTERPLSDVADD